MLTEQMKIRIVVATHKKYWMPEDKIYHPLHVGREGKEDIGYAGDNTGKHISERNANYCELTGMYWAWKNLSDDYIGIVHYRRHFSLEHAMRNKQRHILTESQACALLKNADVILPKPRRYYIETNYSQYAHAHHAQDLDKTREIIHESCSEYEATFDRVMRRTFGHRFNMMIMRRDLYCAYCEWLFEILFKLEERLDISEYSAKDQRVFGYVSERLLDVWLEKNEITYCEIPYLFMEKQNWIVKGSRFLKRKIVHK